MLKSSRGWLPIEDALAAGQRGAAGALHAGTRNWLRADMKAKRAQLLETMRQMPDYSMQLKWELGSSVPGLVSGG